MPGAGGAASWPPSDAFAQAFEPGTNPFGISISKIFPSSEKTVDPIARKAYLIKIQLVLHMPPDGRSYLNAVTGAIRTEKLFCNIWVPRVSEVRVDEYGVYAELLCYLHLGKEGRLLHLDKVIKASPVFGRGPAYSKLGEGDRAFIDTFMDKIKEGKSLDQAMEITVKAVPMMAFGEDAPAAAPEEKEEVEEDSKALLDRISVATGAPKLGGSGDSTYIIGKVVIVDGETGRRLRTAEKKLEDDLDK